MKVIQNLLGLGRSLADAIREGGLVMKKPENNKQAADGAGDKNYWFETTLKQNNNNFETK